MCGGAIGSHPHVRKSSVRGGGSGEGSKGPPLNSYALEPSSTSVLPGSGGGEGLQADDFDGEARAAAAAALSEARAAAAAAERRAYVLEGEVLALRQAMETLMMGG